MTNELVVRMPVLSDTMQEGEIIEWKVETGQSVRKGEALVAVETDKVDMEIECPYEGVVVELLAEPGQAVPVGEPIARIETVEEDLLDGLDFGGPQATEPVGHGAAAGAPADEREPETPQDRPAAAQTTSDGGNGQGTGTAITRATPPARKRAKELGVDLAEVPPTGRRGQITPEDIERYLAERREALPRHADEPAPPAAARAAATASGDRRARLRRATAARMSEAAKIPQFTLSRRIDLERAARTRQGRSWTTEFIRALAAALWRERALHANWDAERQAPVPLDRVRIGVAVDTPDGLVVVGVDDPDGVGPEEADRRVRAAIERARGGQLQPGDTEGLSSTVSNLGGFGVDHFTALLMPPQASILSVGRVAELPALVNGEVRPRLGVEVGLTVDHRIADGADAARLLDRFAQRLEG